MTARAELLRAARDLTASGHRLFSPLELIEQVRRAGGNYPDVTLRTHIATYMCANAPMNQLSAKGEFVRVSQGLYRLSDEREGSSFTWRDKPEGVTGKLYSAGTTRSRGVTKVVAPADPADWYWEGHVQALVVSYLARSGWSIKRVADTASSEHGHDIDAHRGEESVLIEVKGYPTSTYARGEKQGSVRSAGSLGAQARTYFSNALLSGCLMRAENSGARIVLAFPEVETYHTLAGRVSDVLRTAGIEIWLISQEGGVVELPTRRN
jgi:hypothetical protein